MFRNYLKTAFRGFLKHRGFTMINISGLAIGIACCLLIFVYVKDELTYDRYHEKADRLYRMTATINFGGNEMFIGSTAVITPKVFADEIPEIERFARFDQSSVIVEKGEDYIEENRLVYTDPAVFEMFDFELVAGDLNTALNAPDKLVLTREMAEKYFDKLDVVGETMRIRLESDFETLRVAAVIENHPINSSFTFNMMLPWAKYEQSREERVLNNWGMISISSFLELSPGATTEEVIAKMQGVRESHHPDSSAFARRIESDLQNITAMHLDNELGGGNGLGASSDPVYSYVLSGIAFLILIIACINFTNLTVARSLPRAREIGVRKVVGAVKGQLTFQFMAETFMMCLLAFVVGMIIAELLMPYFGTLVEKELDISLFDDSYLVLSSFVIVLLTAFFSGFYPAFVISRFNVVQCLKGSATVRSKKYVTKALVVAQFAIAAVLIIGALTMRSQISYMIEKDLGYNDQHLYRVADYRINEDESSYQLLKGELAANPNVLQVSASDGYGSAASLTKEDGEEFLANTTAISHDYLAIKDIPLLEGRTFKEGEDLIYTADDTLEAVLVNEAFLKELDWEEGIGKQISGYQVVGIVPDYHYGNVRSNVGPLMLQNINTHDRFASEIFVRFRPEYLPQIRSDLETAWRKFVPFFPFEAELESDTNDQRYADEARWNNIISLASSLAIFISCMGLLGLAHLRTQQRVKEIGIRKVLGASVSQIVLLLNVHFIKLVIVSILIATPLAYYLTQEWLANFDNRTDVSVLFFVIPGLAVLMISFLTVSLQSLKQANSNPVDSLRYE